MGEEILPVTEKVASLTLSGTVFLKFLPPLTSAKKFSILRIILSINTILVNTRYTNIFGFKRRSISGIYSVIILNIVLFISLNVIYTLITAVYKIIYKNAN